MKKSVVISLILVIGWMGLIFIMSSSSGEDSGNTSGSIVSFIVDTIDKATGANEETINYHKSEEFLNNANYYFRKTCHFLEYYVLGILLINFFVSLDKFMMIKNISYSILISCLYAASDEYHQTFVNGRGGMVSDVLIDASGALFGIVIAYMFYTIKRKRKKSI